MMYTISNNFDKWVEEYQKQLLKTNIYSIFLMIFIGICICLSSKSELGNDFIFGISGVIIIMLFFIWTYIRASRIFNRTINEIEIDELGLVITTYRFKIFGIFAICEKHIKYDSKGLKFLLSEFPLKQNSKSPVIECYILVIKEVEYYLIHKEFEDSLISALSGK